MRRQKTDTRDAEHLVDLLLANRFPRLWVPSPEERDFRQLLKHRDKLVRMRTSVKNQLHYLAMSQGVCRERKLWSGRGGQELEALRLEPWASQSRRQGSAMNGPTKIVGPPLTPRPARRGRRVA